jgi:hypothetical protein
MASDAREPRLDGNAAAGLLQAILPFDLTVALARCGGCGGVRPVAELAAFVLPIGTVLRCPGCDAVLLRVTQHSASGCYWLDLRGIAWLELRDTAP